MSDFVWAKRRDLHYSPETWRQYCDNCTKLLCTRVEKSRLHPWHYYCEAKSGSMTLKEITEMTDEKCPCGGKLKRGRQ